MGCVRVAPATDMIHLIVAAMLGLTSFAAFLLVLNSMLTKSALRMTAAILIFLVFAALLPPKEVSKHKPLAWRSNCRGQPMHRMCLRNIFPATVPLESKKHLVRESSHLAALSKDINLCSALAALIAASSGKR